MKKTVDVLEMIYQLIGSSPTEDTGECIKEQNKVLDQVSLIIREHKEELNSGGI